MSTLNSRLTAPTGLWLATSGSSTGGWAEEHPPYMSASAKSRWIKWVGPYPAYQVRYRYRDRAVPTSTAVGDWGDWSAWSVDDWDTLDAANWTGSANQGACFFGAALTIPKVDYTTRDKREYQLQVRPYMSSQHGNTATVSIDVYSLATVSITKAVLDDDGGIILTHAIDYPRGGNSLVFRLESYSAGVTVISGVTGSLNLTTTKIPASVLTKDYDVGDTLKLRGAYLTTADGGLADIGDVTLTVQSKYTSTIADPTMTVTRGEDDSVSVALIEAAGSYGWLTASVYATYAYQGVGHRVMPDSSTLDLGTGGKAKNCVFRFESLPYDIDITFVGSVTNDATDSTKGASVVKTTWTMESDGRIRFFIDSETYFLYLREGSPMQPQASFTPNAVSQSMAGAARKKSRHAHGGALNYSIEGTAMLDDPLCPGSEWERLRDQNHTDVDAILCIPRGGRHKVLITGLDITIMPWCLQVTVKVDEVI